MVFSSTATSHNNLQGLQPLRIQRQGKDSTILPSRGVPANVMNPNGLTLDDAEELHSRKWKTSVMNIIPLIALPKLLWDAVFFNPSKAAADREDFLHGDRSYPSAIQQEERKKKAQIKASLIPAFAWIPLVALSKALPAFRKIWHASFIVPMLPAILTALGYGLFENPKAKDFNEQL